MNQEIFNAVRHARTAGYQKAKEGFAYRNNRSLEDYDKYLPAWNFHTFIGLIQHKIDHREHTDQPIRILDLGCGPKANALTDVKQRWLDAVEPIGISADAMLENQTQAMRAISLQRQDIQNAHLVFPKHSMDIITSVQAFPYLPDPYLTLIAINTLLKPDGVALLTNVPISKAIPELANNKEKRHQFLHTLGAKNFTISEKVDEYADPPFVECDIAFPKQPDAFKLPLAYTGVSQDTIRIGALLYHFTRAQYTVVESKII